MPLRSPGRARLDTQRRPPLSPSPNPRRRTFAPKEHGAYGQLVLPMLAALFSGAPGAASLLFAAAALLVFFAHEPLIVMLGHRGARLQREEGPRAWRLLRRLCLGALLSGGLAFYLSPEARLFTMLPLCLFLILIPFLLSQREKTTLGEITAASALASASVPVAVAAQVSAPGAFGAWLSWSLAFAATTISVRSIIAHHKRSDPGGAYTLMLFVTGVALASWVFGVMQVVTVAPIFLLSWVVLLQKPHPKYLKKIGWGLMATTSFAALAMLLLERSS